MPEAMSVLLLMELFGDQSEYSLLPQRKAPAPIHKALKKSGFVIQEVNTGQALFEQLISLKDQAPISAIVLFGQFAGALDNEGDELREMIISEAVNCGNGAPVVYVSVPFANKTFIEGAIQAAPYRGDEEFHRFHGQYFIDVLKESLLV